MEAWEGEAEVSTASSLGASKLWAGWVLSQQGELQLSWRKCCTFVLQVQILHVKAVITLSPPMVFGARHMLGLNIVT